MFLFAVSCYAEDNSHWLGRDTHEERNVASMKDCQITCRDRNIKNFVWMKKWYRCFCKQSANGEVFNDGFVSGYAIENDCAGELVTATSNETTFNIISKSLITIGLTFFSFGHYRRFGLSLTFTNQNLDMKKRFLYTPELLFT